MRKKVGPLWIVLDVLIGVLGLALIAAVFVFGDRLMGMMKTPELVSDAEMPQQYFFSATEWWDEDFPNRAIREEKPWGMTPEQAAESYEAYYASQTDTKKAELDKVTEYMMSHEVQKKLSNRIHNFNRQIDVDEITDMFPAIDSDGKVVVIYRVQLSHTEYEEDEEENVTETVTTKTIDIYGRLPE